MLANVFCQIWNESSKMNRQRSVSKWAANALADFAGDDVRRLARFSSIATPDQYAILYRLIEASRQSDLRDDLQVQVSQTAKEAMAQKDRIALGKRRAGAAITLLRLGGIEKSFDAFQLDDDPESLTQFIHRCRARGVRGTELVDALHMAADEHVRFALILALGNFTLEEIPEPGEVHSFNN